MASIATRRIRSCCQAGLRGEPGECACGSPRRGLTSSTAAGVLAGPSEAALPMAAGRPWGLQRGFPAPGHRGQSLPRVTCQFPLFLLRGRQRWKCYWPAAAAAAAASDPQRPPPRPARRALLLGTTHRAHRAGGATGQRPPRSAPEDPVPEPLPGYRGPVWASPVMEMLEFICKGEN